MELLTKKHEVDTAHSHTGHEPNWGISDTPAR